MRHFVNAFNGHRDKAHETWEQSRMIAYYSSFDKMKKGFKQSDIKIPFDNEGKTKDDPQVNKADRYKLLEKWSK